MGLTCLNGENKPKKMKAEKPELDSTISNLDQKLTNTRIQEVELGLRWSVDDYCSHQPSLEVYS